MRPDGPRDPIIGSDAGPEPPFPLRMGGKVVSGFGRGSKDLGIPTANIPVEGVPWIEEAKSGVYFGWAGIKLPDEHAQLNSEAEGTVKPSAAFTTSAPPLCPVSPPKEAAEKGWRLFPMVMSIGYNPFYRNTVRSAEVHVMRGFEKDFYGCEMKISILGWIREEYDYVSREALVDDIRMDIEVAGKSLERKAWGDRAQDPYLWGEGADFPSSKAQKI